MINRFHSLFQEYKSSFFAGLLLGTSFIPFLPWAVIFFFVPLWWYWLNNSSSLKKILISGWISSFVLNLIGAYWVAYVAREHAHLPWPVAILVMLLCAALSGYYIPLAGLIWHYLQKYLKSPLSKIICIALITALTERFYVTLFAWNFGYTYLSAQLPIYQLADIIGFNGLSTLTLLINALSLYGFYLYKNKKKFLRPLFLVFLISVTLNLLGALRASQLKDTDAFINVLTVQANIGNLAKEAAQRGRKFRTEIIDKYTQLTHKALKENHNVDYVLWPETAIPLPLTGKKTPLFTQRLIQKVLAPTKAHLISGSYHYNKKNGRTANSVYFFNPNGEVIHEPYKKTHLLAFGEYVPGAKYFPKLAESLNISEFEAGNGPEAYNVNGVKFGPQICYESLFEDFSIDLAKAGAQVFINFTNDSWFGPASEPYQNLYSTLARGIEHRRPVIRSTNTGFTTVMTPKGQILKTSPLFKEWTHIYKVPYYKNNTATFYQKFPWLITLFLCLSLVTLLFWDKYGSKK